MNWCLQCDEASLRDVISTPMGPEVAELVLDAVEGGVVIEVMAGGKARRAEDHESALALLKSFQLTSEHPKKDLLGHTPESPIKK